MLNPLSKGIYLGASCAISAILVNPKLNNYFSETIIPTHSAPNFLDLNNCDVVFYG